MKSHISVGSGSDESITEVAQLIQKVVGYHGQIVYDTSKQDGAAANEWAAKSSSFLVEDPPYCLLEGLQMTYDVFLKNPT